MRNSFFISILFLSLSLAYVIHQAHAFSARRTIPGRESYTLSIEDVEVAVITISATRSVEALLYKREDWNNENYETPLDSSTGERIVFREDVSSYTGGIVLLVFNPHTTSLVADISVVAAPTTSVGEAIVAIIILLLSCCCYCLSIVAPIIVIIIIVVVIAGGAAGIATAATKASQKKNTESLNVPLHPQDVSSTNYHPVDITPTHQV